MSKTFLAIGFALAAIGLSACNQDDRPATAPETGTGSVRIQLPAVPQEYLAKAGAVAATKALFSLTISGPAMKPITKTWTLSSDKQEPVVVTGIPAGYMRVFYGRLLKAGAKDTSATHEGYDSAWIERDSTADVHLYLRKKGNGSAHVCLDVEGWAADTLCYPPVIDSFPVVEGCYNMAVTKKGVAPKPDTLFKAKLRLDQSGTKLFATVTWPSGARDSAFGTLFPSGSMDIGAASAGGGGQFRFLGVPDSLGTGSLRGFFADSLRHVNGQAIASRAACDTLVPPPKQDSAKACFSVSQSLTKGTSGLGRLALISVGQSYWGAFRWNGFPSMTVLGHGPLMGSLKDTASLSLDAVAPKGLIDTTGKTTDTLSYRSVIYPGGATMIGDVRRLTPTGLVANGSWKITRSACTVKDSLP